MRSVCLSKKICVPLVTALLGAAAMTGCNGGDGSSSNGTAGSGGNLPLPDVTPPELPSNPGPAERVAPPIDLMTVYDAAEFGEMERMKELIDDGAQFDVPNGETGYTALGSATLGGQNEVVAYLLEIGADPTIANSQGVTSVHLAARGNQPEILRTLLEAGANPNAAPGASFSPLLWAARAGALEACELLIEHGADVNFSTAQGTTPLSIAQRAEPRKPEHDAIVALLVEHGAE